LYVPSRNGNQFPAPDWFKAGLPPTPLDGELWCGRRQFRRCLSIVRNRSSGKLWECVNPGPCKTPISSIYIYARVCVSKYLFACVRYITYLVFDAPAMDRVSFRRVKGAARLTGPDRSVSLSLMLMFYWGCTGLCASVGSV